MYHTHMHYLFKIFYTLGPLPPAPVIKNLMYLQVSNWYRVGLALDLESYDLDIIREVVSSPDPLLGLYWESGNETIGKDNQGDTKTQTLNCKMFQLWLTRQPQALYKQMIQVLHEVGDQKEVTFLCRKYGEYQWYTYANLTGSTMTTATHVVCEW